MTAPLLIDVADPWAGRPTPAGGVLARPRLVAALGATAAGCVAVLSAPAGYGKTTLLCQWEAADPRPFAWLTVDHRDDEDPARLRERAAALLEPMPAGEPFVVVLDDAHALRAAATRLAVRRIAADLPPEAVLAIATRAEAPLPIARLRAEHRLVELGTGRLAMHRDEVATLIALDGRRLPADELDALMALTEGWPAALSLALLALAEGRIPTELSAADDVFAAYLEDEVLSGLRPSDRVFLRRTSVLRTLTGPGCDAVLDRTGSAGVLARLAFANVLLIPLDRRGEQLRCHRLLAGALTAELARVEPGHADRLHRRAAGWCGGAGDLDGAVRHALAGGDVPRAARMTWATAAHAVAHGDAAAVARRLALFSARETATQPELALTAATTGLIAGRGDLVSHWSSAAAVFAPADAPPAVFGTLAVLRAALGHDGLPGAIDDAARAAAQLSGDDLGIALCHFVAGAARHLLGDRERARAELTSGARRAAVAAPVLHALCLAQLAVLAVEREDRAEATELVARARAQVERHGLQDAPACALVFAASAAVRAQDGRAEDARADLAHTTRLQEALIDFAPWYEAELRILSAWAAWRLCDVPGAIAHLNDAARYVRLAPEATVLTAWLDGTQDQVAQAAAPTASLTAAELRILRYLPTHLSFREIAERTFVSANTVKTQANAVYRKLDVSSRSEAVTRARSLGVLDPA
jgi:LuxR family maltose regulon positive regulatory protein